MNNHPTQTPVQPAAKADYVIVGGGSAGCVLGNRLSADPANRVILIEAGGWDNPFSDPANFYKKLNIHIPSGFANIFRDPLVNWGYASTPQAHAGGRRIDMPRGLGIGGSSSINGLVYLRGLPLDFDQWRQLGCTGWGFDDVLPYFKRSQHFVRGGDEQRGTGGPLGIDKARVDFPAYDMILRGWGQLGVPTVDTLNAATELGVARCEITTRGGRRQSAATAFLRPALKRPNLQVMTGMRVEKIVLDGRRAVGVLVRGEGAERRWISAEKEVILSAGTVGSAHILQLSGIGPGAWLQDAGIAVEVENGAIGKGLQDHYSSQIKLRMKQGVPSINNQTRGWRLAAHVMNYFLRRRGLLTAGGGHITAFAATDGGDVPDVQFWSTPLTTDLTASGAAGKVVLDSFPGWMFSGCPMRPRSRGTLRVTSPDPTVAPDIDPNFLDDPYDQSTIVAGLKMNRALISQPAIAALVEEELTPGPAIASDEALLDHARRTGNTTYHLSGSCAMGGREDSAVDPTLKVRGVEGLRVVDASIMPIIPSANLNAPTIMIAEKGADMILRDRR